MIDFYTVKVQQYLQMRRTAGHKVPSALYYEH